jgi:hypothetical protein
MLFKKTGSIGSRYTAVSADLTAFRVTALTVGADKLACLFFLTVEIDKSRGLSGNIFIYIALPDKVRAVEMFIDALIFFIVTVAVLRCRTLGADNNILTVEQGLMTAVTKISVISHKITFKI